MYELVKKTDDPVSAAAAAAAAATTIKDGDADPDDEDIVADDRSRDRRQN